MMLILDPSIEEMKFRFGEHKKTHPKRLNLKHTLKQTMKPKPTQHFRVSRTTESIGAERTKSALEWIPAPEVGANWAVDCEWAYCSHEISLACIHKKSMLRKSEESLPSSNSPTGKTWFACLIFFCLHALERVHSWGQDMLSYWRNSLLFYLLLVELPLLLNGQVPT